MALIVITIQDTNSGVSVEASHEPQVVNQTDLSPALQLGAVALQAIKARLETEASAIDLSAAPSLAKVRKFPH